MRTEENGCDCVNCESAGGECLAGFCAVCLTELGTGEPWGAVCADCLTELGKAVCDCD